MEFSMGSVVLDGWKIIRLLGEGSYGKVFEIERSEFGQTYRAALKVITVPQSSAEVRSVISEGMSVSQAEAYFHGIVEELMHEFSIMFKLKGTANVVSCEDLRVLEHPDGIGWDILIRMELLHPLLPYVYQHPMARRDIIRLGIDICKALELCQRYNIIHRDIKPENIFISDNGDYKLGDFGIARTIERTTSGLSKKGTYSYMAPEVYIGKKYGFSVDTYSLGLVLYRMLNKNRGPFLPQPPEAITYDNREQALGCFEQAQALYPEESAPYISYAYALYCAQDYERCISYIEDELGLGKAYDIEAQSQLSEILGAAYFECDDYAAAASFFRLSTAGGDITVNAQRDYAVSLGRLGDIDAADEILSQMYAAGASGDVTDYVQAEIDYAKKEYLDAESGFQAVLNQTQDIALQKRALRSLAEVYRDCAALVRTGSSPIGNPATKAVEVLANGIETYGLRYDSTIWEMLALAYFEAYHTDPSVPQSYLRKAGECFNRVLELGVTKSYLYSNLYTIYYELQEYDLAEQTLDAYAAQYPKDYEPYAFRAMLYITLENRKEQSARDYSAAVEAYETAGQLLRSDDDATYYQQLQSLIQQLQKEGWING